MELVAACRLSQAREVVFAAYRDRLPELVPHLPNIRAIEVKLREQEGNVVRLYNLWRGGGEIPALARAFVSESMLSWDDHACWDEQRWCCAWRIETHVFRDAVHCHGENRFTEIDGGTLLEIHGELEVDARKVPGVPGGFAGRVGRAVERYLVGKIEPNLVQVARGLELLLAQPARPLG